MSWGWDSLLREKVALKECFGTPRVGMGGLGVGCPSSSLKACQEEGVWEPLGKRQGMVPGEMLEPSRFVPPKAQIISSPAKGRGGWEAVCPVQVLQLELNLNSFAGKPPGTFLSIASTDAWKRINCIDKRIFVKHENSLDASIGHKILGNGYLLSKSLRLFCMFMWVIRGVRW